MGRSQVPELDLRGRPVGMDVDREGSLEQAVVFAPVHFGVNFEGLATPGQAQGLDGAGGAERVLDAYCGFFGPARQDGDALRRAQVLAGVAIKGVDVPGRPLVGDIRVELEHVGGRPRGQHFPLGHPVPQRDDVAVAVEPDRHQAVSRPFVG